MRYDDWKATDPRDAEPRGFTCACEGECDCYGPNDLVGRAKIGHEVHEDSRWLAEEEEDHA